MVALSKELHYSTSVSNFDLAGYSNCGKPLRPVPEKKKEKNS